MMTQKLFPNGRFPSALLSDMDGVLLDTERLSKKSFDVVTDDYNITDAGFIFPNLIGLNQAGHLSVFREMLPSHIDIAAFDSAWKSIFLAMVADGVPIKYGAKGLLAHFHGRGIPIAVVTSTGRKKAEDLLARAGLDGYLDAVIGGDDVSRGKPDAEPYLKGAKALGQPIDDCLVLEDSDNGVRAAHAAGAVVVHIPDPSLGQNGGEVDLMCDAVITAIDGLYPLLGWDRAV